MLRYQSSGTPLKAIAQRKRNAALRHEARAAEYRREADEIDARAADGDVDDVEVPL